jgi:high-affinity Fe2+/Pb2+ permease
LVLFLVWKDQKPKTAKAAGIGALISVVLGVLFYVVVFVIMGAAGIAAGAF